MPKTMQTIERIADLDVIVKRTGSEGPAVVILHGYGADMNDLAPLSDVLPEPSTGTWYFPNAPLEVPIGPSMMGRAWFPIDMAALEEAMMTGSHRDFSSVIPEGFLKAQEQVCKFLKALDRKPEDIILGGFSQGAMISCDVALHMESNLRGLALLSGNMVAKERWEKIVANRTGLKVFQSHGQQDQVLGFDSADNLSKMLIAAQANVQFVPFQGGHEIPNSVMQELARFLGTLSPI